MNSLHRWLAGLTLAMSALLGSGCTTTVVLMHLHAKLTEGDPIPCANLGEVARALEARCGPFEPGRIVSKDIQNAHLPECPLTLAARDPQFWPVLPDLLAAGAMPERCAQPPLVALAQAQACPPFAQASAPARSALRWLAMADSRSVHHDVMRALSCPEARAADLDQVLDDWHAQGLLSVDQASFSPLDALHPSHLGSRLAARLEAAGHRADHAFGAYAGHQPSGFEAALRTGDLAALDWWLQRVPTLANRVPPSLGGQLPWRPLARLLTPKYMNDPTLQRRTAEFLLTRGADPWLRLPQEPQRTVVSLARDLKSPLLPLLDVPPLRQAGRAATPPQADASPASQLDRSASASTATATQVSALGAAQHIDRPGVH